MRKIMRKGLTLLLALAVSVTIIPFPEQVRASEEMDATYEEITSSESGLRITITEEDGYLFTAERVIDEEVGLLERLEMALISDADTCLITYTQGEVSLSTTENIASLTEYLQFQSEDLTEDGLMFYQSQAEALLKEALISWNEKLGGVKKSIQWSRWRH